MESPVGADFTKGADGYVQHEGQHGVQARQIRFRHVFRLVFRLVLQATTPFSAFDTGL